MSRGEGSDTDRMVDQALRDYLLAYAEGRCSLEEFYRWFMATVVTPLDDLVPDPAAQRRVYDIVRELAEYTDGIWTEAQLRRRLRRYSREPLLQAVS